MNKTFKALFLLFAVTLILCLCACGSNDAQTAVTAKVKISSDYALVDTDVTIKNSVPNAAYAVIEACKANKIAYNVNNGMFDGFGGIESSKQEGWLLYLNGTLSPTGAEDTSIRNDDVIEFRYENYDKAFNATTTDYIGKWRCESAPDGSAAFLTLDENEANFTYIDAQRTTTSYVGRYTIANNKITIEDVASKSTVAIPFQTSGEKIVITFNAKSIEMSRQ